MSLIECPDHSGPLSFWTVPDLNRATQLRSNWSLEMRIWTSPDSVRTVRIWEQGLRAFLRSVSGPDRSGLRSRGPFGVRTGPDSILAVRFGSGPVRTAFSRSVLGPDRSVALNISLGPILVRTGPQRYFLHFVLASSEHVRSYFLRIGFRRVRTQSRRIRDTVAPSTLADSSKLTANADRLEIN